MWMNTQVLSQVLSFLFYKVRHMKELGALLTLAMKQRRINQRITVEKMSKETTKEIKASVKRTSLISYEWEVYFWIFILIQLVIV